MGRGVGWLPSLAALGAGIPCKDKLLGKERPLGYWHREGSIGLVYTLLVPLLSLLPALAVTGFGESWSLGRWRTLRSELGVFRSDMLCA